jgi:preprotein translocase subunit SecA
MNLLRKIFGSKNDRELKRLREIVVKVNALEPQVVGLAPEQFPQKTAELKARAANGESLDSLLPEAFALCREAAKRVRQERHYDVQIIGGAVLHEGKISEMKTGEGKTLTATLALYLNALAGKGAHLVTVNDYLAKRDSDWMGEVYRYLGMTTGAIVHGLTDAQRREAYHCDITYGTNNEFGFDFLRDNMKTERERMVQRPHFFAIVDEVDSILIDEARTPLIISGPTDTNTELFTRVNTAIPGLQKDSDYIVDEKSRSVALTEDGITKVEKRLRVDNLYDPKNIDVLHHVQQAMKAHIVFKKDVDYVVRDGKVIIVDEFTGRLMPGRRYSDGLHGALEAKEHVQVQTETQTLATITFQNYFRLYKKLAGMTGTADTEAVEFKKIYNLDVIVIPTNRTMTRVDDEDVVFRTAREKFNVIADEIEAAQKKGQPVLVGTVSVEKSELLASLLKKRNIEHDILNAKNHSREAEIIANAGQLGRVTISTNMAGRGTDIKLGPGVVEAGGLYVIGTERHESRRIDNQLRGRSGRQGDAGRTKFFLSLEDDLMRIFASDRLSAIMQRLGMKEGESIVSPMVSRAIERAQKRVEEQNFGSRKHLLEYDDVMNQQRQVVYGLRNKALDGEKLDFLRDATAAILDNLLHPLSPEALHTEAWDLKTVADTLKSHIGVLPDLSGVNAAEATLNEVVNAAVETAVAHYDEKLKVVQPEFARKLEGWIYLQVIDRAWKNHLLAMDALKDSVSLRGYGQRDPLQEYKKEAFRMFADLMHRIQDETATALLHLEIKEESKVPEAKEPDTSKMNFRHPDAQSAAPAKAAPAPASASAPGARAPQQAAPQRAAPANGDDGMIYHGSRASQQPPQKPVAQTFKRADPKVGRNDPCPCGSGKKYKKCHGANEEAGSSAP